MTRVRMIQMRSLSVLFLFFSPSYLSQLTSWEEHSYSRCGRDGHSQTGSWCMVVILRQVVGIGWSFLDRQLVCGGHSQTGIWCMVGQVRLKHFLGRALRLGQARGRALRLGQATGPSDRVYELNKDNNVFKTIRIKKEKY